MSAVDVDQPPSVVPQRRRRPSPAEIIDVDLLDDNELVQNPSPQRRRLTRSGTFSPPRSDSILVLDSDDERDIQFMGSNFSSPHRVRSNNRSRIFSPPPRIQEDIIPPVPPVPGRYLVSLRRRESANASGVVIPNENPFPFEARIRAAPRRPDNPPAPIHPPPAAAPSHHMPVMGFGGAILAMARNTFGRAGQANDYDDEEGRVRRHRFHYPPAAVSMFRRWGGFGDQDPMNDFDDDFFPIFGHDDHFFNRRGGSAASRDKEPDYKPEYTHPEKPAPGFTHDFDPSHVSSSPPSHSQSVIIVDDSPGSSKASSSRTEEENVTLACAHCQDPLFLGGADVAEGRNRRKLWGLRCGHLLDGKCVERIMRPAIPISAFEVDSKVDIKGKGKAKVEPDLSGCQTIPVMPITPSKGKGKAIGDGDPDIVQDVDSIANTQTFTPHTSYDNGSIRSRLRPRHPQGVPPHDFPSSPSPNRVRAMSNRRRGAANSSPGGFASPRFKGKGKGKGKAKGPVIEAEHEWKCPVSGCERVHLSVLIGGQWTMDKNRGAIVVFV